MFKNRALKVPKHCQQDLTGRGIQLGYFERRRVFPLHAPSLVLWFMMNTAFTPVMIPFKKFHLYGCTTQKHYSSCAYALLSDVCAPTLGKLCGTPECHALKKRP
jgi:hypothetical protein